MKDKVASSLTPCTERVCAPRAVVANVTNVRMAYAEVVTEVPILYPNEPIVGVLSTL